MGVIYFIKYYSQYPPLSRLHDVLHNERKLTLIFEYCDQVLNFIVKEYSHKKRYMTESKTISVYVNIDICLCMRTY